MFTQVLLHEAKDRPLMLQRGFKVSPGFVTQVAVSATYVSNSFQYAHSYNHVGVKVK